MRQEWILVWSIGVLLALSLFVSAAEKPPSPASAAPPLQAVSLATEDQSTFEFLKAQLLNKLQEYRVLLGTIDAFGTQARDRLKLDGSWQLDIATGKFVPRSAAAPTGPAPLPGIPEAATGPMVP